NSQAAAQANAPATATATTTAAAVTTVAVEEGVASVVSVQPGGHQAQQSGGKTGKLQGPTVVFVPGEGIKTVEINRSGGGTGEPRGSERSTVAHHLATGWSDHKTKLAW
ncbi:hypothetical protein BIW11_08876, partial [Tropilaelaps mercedesae]